MRSRGNNRSRRRATVLLMVVSVLALLVVIVASFLSIARNSRKLALDVAKGETADNIVSNVDDMAIDLIASQLRDSKGHILGGAGNAFSLEDIPGYAYSHYLASSEPIWYRGVSQPTFTATSTLPADFDALSQLVWPSMTALEGNNSSTPKSFRLLDLLVEDDSDTDAVIETANNSNDVSRYALRPFMDADADGLPDSHLLLTAPATEAANAILGRSVALPEFPNLASGAMFDLNPAAIPSAALPNNQQRLRWNQWKRDSRVEIATRIISHGGMLALDAPAANTPSGATPPPQRAFVMDMFDALRRGNDRAMKSVYGSSSSQDALFGALSTYRDSVEGSLRRRFLLPSAEYVDDNGRYRLDAPILEQLQRTTTGFPETFVPSLAGLNAPAGAILPLHQRVNIADTIAQETPLQNWSRAVSYSAASGAGLGGFGSNEDLHAYDMRHQLTTTSNSDELARKQDENEPDAMNPLRTYRGELKFYLGEVSKVFDAAGSTYTFNAVRGATVVGRLAPLFTDMLANAGAAADWSTLSMGGGGGKEVLSKSEQAYMLAVNLMGFASPRDNTGWIEPTFYSDALTNRTYVGFTPQPFISEVVAYNAANAPPPTGQTRPGDSIAVAVELFNPFDSLPGDASDIFGLNANQYAVSIEEMNDPMGGGGTGSGFLVLGSQFTNAATRAFGGFPGPAVDRFKGRTFRAFIIEDSTGNNAFSAVVNKAGLAIGDRSFDTMQPKLTVRLWKASRATMGWFCIDEVEVSMPNQTTPTSGAADPRWTSARREVMRTAQLGAPDIDGDALPDYARWGVVTNNLSTASGSGGPVLNGVGTAQFLINGGALINPDGVVLPTVGRIAPDTPFPTMNAAPLNNLALFGNVNDLRPTSFPTVGYMLYMPRFAHVSNLALSQTDPKRYLTMSKILAAQWASKGYQDRDGNQLVDFPIDFGHMPVFDNTMNGSGYFNSNRAGVIPWGQLVFDYFTTLNPQAPGVDPLRVAGRLNVNVASWHMLSKLPMIGPVPATGRVPIRAAGVAAAPTFADPSPSFWEPSLGVTTGMGVEPITNTPLARFVGTEVSGVYQKHMPYYDTPNQRWRLGDWLAISATSYRDGLQYLPSSGSSKAVAFADSHLRGRGKYQSSGGIVDAIDYRPNPPAAVTTYGTMRGAPASASAIPTEYGFLSIGEMLNVKGFDATEPAKLPPLDNTPNAGNTTLAQRFDGLTGLATSGDYLKGISLLTAIDTQYLTTRSNTFTVYSSVMDAEHPESSVRSQVTIDRSNLLPRLEYGWVDVNGNNKQDAFEITVPRVRTSGTVTYPVRTENISGKPQIISQRRGSYFATQYND